MQNLLQQGTEQRETKDEEQFWADRWESIRSRALWRSFDRLNIENRFCSIEYWNLNIEIFEYWDLNIETWILRLAYLLEQGHRDYQ